jgi:nucleoside-diphosphate-sugar epimerase
MVELGFHIRCLSPDEPMQHPNVEWVKMDFLEDLDFARAMPGVTHVLHLGAELWNEKTMDRINCTASGELAKAAEAAGVKYFCYTSSICVYGSPSRRKVTEDMPLMPLENAGRYDYMENEFMIEYARTKRVGEEMIRREAAKTRYVFFRPTEISWEHDILKARKWGPKTRIWRSGRHCHVVYYRDVINAILFFLLRSVDPSNTQKPGEIIAYNLSNDDAANPRFCDFMKQVYAETGDGRYHIPFSAPMWMEYVKEHIKWKVWKHCYSFGLTYIDPSKLYATGYRHEYGLEAARRSAIERLKKERSGEIEEYLGK